MLGTSFGVLGGGLVFIGGGVEWRVEWVVCLKVGRSQSMMSCR